MNNVEFIKDWFIKKNIYLSNSSNREEILNILLFYAIVFEKLEDINDDDQIVIKDDVITYVSGPVKESQDLIRLLNVINFKYGYLDYEDLVQTAGYRMIKESGINGSLSDEVIVEYLDTIFDNVMHEYENYDFNKEVYKINGKVFFCDSKLKEEEIEKLYNLEDEQKLFEVYHDEKGKMRVY